MEKPWAGARILARECQRRQLFLDRWDKGIRESGKGCSCALIWPEAGAPQQKGLGSRVIHGKSTGPALWPPFC